MKFHATYIVHFRLLQLCLTFFLVHFIHSLYPHLQSKTLLTKCNENPKKPGISLNWDSALKTSVYSCATEYKQLSLKMSEWQEIKHIMLREDSTSDHDIENTQIF